MSDCPVCGPAGEEGPCLAHSAPLLTPPTPDPRERGETSPERDALYVAIVRYGDAREKHPGDYAVRDEAAGVVGAAIEEFAAALRAPAPSEAVAWLIEKPQPGGVYWWHGKRHALAAINEDYNPDHFPSAIAYEFGPVAAEAVRFNSREDADVVIRRFPPQWRSVLIASEHMWVSAHPAPARGVTVTEAMVRAAQNAPVCALHVGWNGNNESIECDDCLRNALTAALTAALTPDAEGGA